MSVATMDSAVAGVPLTAIQRQAFEVLSVLAKFCDQHGICYYMVGGTLLGAVRHGGFIPWDDDIDIVIPRPDYRRLLAMIDQLPEPLKAIHPSNDKTTPYPFLVVRRAGSRLVIDYERPFDRGIGVDVFPLDAVPVATWRRRLLFRFLRFMRSASMNKQRGYYRRQMPLTTRLRFALLSAVNRALPARFIYRAYDLIVAHGDVCNSVMLGNLYGLYGTREIVDRQVFGEGCWLEFEGQNFRAPEHPEQYLAAVYGDFRCMPPENLRHSGHRIKAVSLDE
ncbi:LicD family protein [Stutzerimonas stutzeri]|uniref:LicD family protein n=1 Tax=Stutzerimonas stutzeri TaxID=316 RepID=UPI001480135D|nr:LicD family protein [Stutzerimonas stutzeri]WRQ04730.1 LicD family protein [Stutzerimonas stutzeri]